MGDVHVVFGTGAIGLALIDELTALNLPVRAVNRSGRAPVPRGVELMAGDASNPQFAAQAAKQFLIQKFREAELLQSWHARNAAAPRL